MPLSINQVANDEASVTFPYASGTLTIVYYPSRISDKMLRSLSKVKVGNIEAILDGFDSVNDLLAKVIKSWDFFKDVEQTVMWPLDAESLADLPMTFKQDVFVKIAENMNPNSKAV